MSKDLYEVLGVAKDATDKEVQKAYRKLVREHHPDTSNEEDRAKSEERMKEINAAYAILSNPEKRQRYDVGGLDNLHGNDFGSGFETFDFRDIFGGNMFNHVFGGHANQQHNFVQKGSDIRVAINRDLSDSWKADKRTVDYQQHVSCPSCDGTGASETKECTICHGLGYRQVSQQAAGMVISQRSVCSDCNGTGKQTIKKCDDCNGLGYTTEKQTVSVDIPQGVINNVLVMTGSGNRDGSPNHPGDLLIEVTADIPDGYTISENIMVGRMLTYSMPISMTTALLGGQEGLEHITGEHIDVNVSPGTQNGDSTVFHGKGLPGLNNGQNGDLFVHFTIAIPTSLTDEQIELLEKIRDAGL